MNTFVAGNVIVAAEVNANFDETTSRIDNEAALSKQFSLDADSVAGLHVAIFGGNVAGIVRAGNSFNLTPSATNYIELNTASGAISANTAGFTAGREPLYVFTCGATEITAFSDRRGWAGGAASTLEGHNAAYFLARANHTGTQAAATISDFAEAVDDRVAALLAAGSGISVSYDDTANTFTITNGAPLTTEAVQDIVGAMVAAGINASAVYDDAAGTLTIGAPGENLSTENIQDIVAALLVQGTNVTLSYNDTANTLTVTAAGGSGGVTGVTASNGVQSSGGSAPNLSLDIAGMTASTTPDDADYVPGLVTASGLYRKFSLASIFAKLLAAARIVSAIWTFTKQVNMTPDADTGIALVITPHSATQSADLLRVMNAAGTRKMVSVTPDGDLYQTGEANGGNHQIDRATNTLNNGPTFQGRRARGSIAAPTAVLADTRLVQLSGTGYDSSDFFTQAALIALAEQDWTSTHRGTYVDLQLTPHDSTTLASYFRFKTDGLYWWNGSAFVMLGSGGTSETVVSFNTVTPSAVTTGGVSYKISCTFSGTGVFGDALYKPVLTANNANVIITENLNPKTTGIVAFSIYVPASEISCGGLTLVLTLKLKGTGWTGSSTSGVTGSWSSLVQI